MSRIPYYIYYISSVFYKYKIPFIPNFFMYLNRIIWGVYIPASCSIGKLTKFGYAGSGVVIHARAIIGRNCIINPSVTIGGKSKKNNVPVIGDNVYLGSGSKILGDVKIGNDVIIGANCVVLHDIPSGCIAVGIPAKIIKKGIKMQDYI